MRIDEARRKVDAIMGLVFRELDAARERARSAGDLDRAIALAECKQAGVALMAGLADADDATFVRIVVQITEALNSMALRLWDLEGRQ